MSGGRSRTCRTATVQSWCSTYKRVFGHWAADDVYALDPSECFDRGGDMVYPSVMALAHGAAFVVEGGKWQPAAEWFAESAHPVFVFFGDPDTEALPWR